MHEGADANTDEHINEHAAHNAPGIADDGRQALHEGGLLARPLRRLLLRLRLHLLHPIAQERLEAHAPQHDAANAA